MDSNYIYFKKELEKFIERFYYNRFIVGLVLFIIGFLIIFLVSSFIEYFSWASKNTRLFILLGSILSLIFIFYYFLLVPILRYFKILPQITHRHAIRLISNSFPDSKDLLINILELNSLYLSDSSNQLLLASINQKIQESKKFNFSLAINNRNIFPLVKYLVVLIFVYIAILIFSPEVIIDSSSRIIHFNRLYEKNFGFTIEVDNLDLIVEKGKNKKINIRVVGTNYPENLNIQVNGQEYLLSRKSINNYSYEFKNIHNSFKFRIVNSFFSSKDFSVTVNKPPIISKSSILIEYPKYLGLNDYSINDNLSIKVPFGSTITWSFETVDLDSLYFNSDSIFISAIRENDFFSLKKSILMDFNYSIQGSNSYFNKIISTNNKIIIIPDLFPTITVQEYQNQENLSYFIYKGSIDDDYGFSKLLFVCNNKNQDTIIPILFNKNINSQEFYFAVDYSLFKGKEFVSYFAVFDNDEINFFKQAQSNKFRFKIPDYIESANELATKQKQIEDDFERSLQLAQELLNNTKELKKRLITENLTSFEKANLVNDLVDKQNELNKLFKDLSNNNLSKSSYEKNFSKQSKDILEKQEQIQQLLESILTDELKELFKELEKLRNEFNQDNFNNISMDLERNYDELSKQLDRNLELVKRLEVEKEINDIIEQLELLSKNQELISKELQKDFNFDSVKNANSFDEKLAEQLSTQYEKIQGENSNLDKPLNIGDFQDDFNQLKEYTKTSLDPQKTKKEKIDKTLENSKSAKELASKLKNGLNKSNSNQNEEDYNSLRQILENLLFFSFEQESLNIQFGRVSLINPNFDGLLLSQNNLSDIFIIIKDSLNAVSKRNPYLGNHISQKAFSIENKLFDIKEFKRDEVLRKIGNEQRYIIEYSNDLILLLSESLKNLESMFGSDGDSGSKKNKPKPGKPSLSEMRKSQEGIKEQLEGMINQMKQGSKSGNTPSSEKLGRMLSQQEVFQQMINELSSGSGVGKEYSKQLQEISKLLDANKQDIARMQVSQITLNRQNQIVTRLLEAEKAEQEREIDDLRKSKEGGYYSIVDPKALFDNELQKINFEEIFNKSSIQLNSFYKNKYQEYINKLNQAPDEKGN